MSTSSHPPTSTANVTAAEATADVAIQRIAVQPAVNSSTANAVQYNATADDLVEPLLPRSTSTQPTTHHSRRLQKAKSLLHDLSNHSTFTLTFHISVCAILWVLNNIYWVLTTTAFGTTYILACDQITTALYLVLALPLLVVKLCSGKGIHRDNRQLHWGWYVSTALCDALVGLAIGAGSVMLSGTIQTLLSQLTIPVCMLLAASPILRTRFTTYQCIGATIIFVGSLLPILPSLLAPPPPPDSSTADATQASAPLLDYPSLLVFIIGICAASVSNILKEKMLKSNPIDLMLYNTVEQFLAWVLTFAMTPFLFIPGVPSLDTKQTVIQHFLEGGQCWFNGYIASASSSPGAPAATTDPSSSVTDSTADASLQMCDGLFLTTIWYTLANFSLSIYLLYLTRAHSATLVNIVNCLQIPLSSYAFSSTLIMGLTLVSPFNNANVAALVVTIIGFLVYQHTAQEQSDDPADTEHHQYRSIFAGHSLLPLNTDGSLTDERDADKQHQIPALLSNASNKHRTRMLMKLGYEEGLTHVQIRKHVSFNDVMSPIARPTSSPKWLAKRGPLMSADNVSFDLNTPTSIQSPRTQHSSSAAPTSSNAQ